MKKTSEVQLSLYEISIIIGGLVFGSGTVKWGTSDQKYIAEQEKFYADLIAKLRLAESALLSESLSDTKNQT